MSNKNRRYRAYAVEYTFCAHVTVDPNIMVLHTLRIVLLHHMIKKTYTIEPFGKPWNNDNAERKQTLVNSGKSIVGAKSECHNQTKQWKYHLGILL